MKNREKIFILIAVLIATGFFSYWYLRLRGKIMLPAAQNSTVPAASLGETIYQKAQNPISDKVPAVTPVTNPIEGVYKNPFQ